MPPCAPARPNVRKRAWRRSGIAAVCLGLGLSAAPVQAGKIVVFCQGSLAMNEEVIEGLKMDTGDDVQVNTLGPETAAAPAGLKNSIPAEAQSVVVLSRDTLHLIEADLPDLPVVYTLVVAPYAFASPRHAGCVLIQPSVERQFEALSALLPGRKKMLVIYNPVYSQKSIADARDLSGKYGFQLLPIAVENQSEALHCLDGVEQYSADVIWSVLDRTVSQPEVVRKTIEVAHARNLPFIGQTIYHVRAGALAAICADYSDIGQQCVQLARKIRANPATEQKIETPRKIIIYLNATVKKSLNLTISPTLPDVRQVE